MCGEPLWATIPTPPAAPAEWIDCLILAPNLLSMSRTWPIIARSACFAICCSTALTALPCDAHRTRRKAAHA